MNKITPQQLKERLDRDKIKVLDVRSEDKFQIGHLKHKHAENIHVFKEEIFALEEPEKNVSLPFSPDQEIIVTCTSGNSATRCTKILAKKGYNVTLLDGGMVAWNKNIS